MNVIIFKLESWGIYIGIASSSLYSVFMQLLFYLLAGKLFVKRLARKKPVFSDYLPYFPMQFSLRLALRSRVEMLDKPIIREIEQGLLGGCVCGKQDDPDELEHCLHNHSLEMQSCHRMLPSLCNFRIVLGINLLNFLELGVILESQALNKAHLQRPQCKLRFSCCLNSIAKLDFLRVD